MQVYRVVRDCHNSGGVCDLCTVATGKVRRVQIDNLVKEKAEQVARNWHEYNATVEKMGEVAEPELIELDKVAVACKEVSDRAVDAKDDTPYTIKKVGNSFRFVQEITVNNEVFEVQVRKVK